MGIDFYKREGRDGNISQLMYCMKGGYVPNDMIECGLLLWKYFDKEEKIKQLTWKDENDRTIDDIKEYCLTNEARDLVQEWRKECGLNELEHLKERTVGYPRRPSYIESELEDFDIDDWTKSEDGKEEEKKMIARSKALSDKLWEAGWHFNQHFNHDYPINRLTKEQLEKKLTALCKGYKAFKKAKSKEEIAYIAYIKECQGGMEGKYTAQYDKLIKALQEKYEEENEDDRKEFKLEESLDLDLDDDLDLDLDLDDNDDLNLDDLNFDDSDGDKKEEDAKKSSDDLDLNLDDDDDIDLDLDLSLDSNEKDKDKDDLLSVQVETAVVTDNSMDGNDDKDEFHD